MSNERYEVLGQIVEAVKLVCDCKKVSALIPEVRSNITMCIRNPKSPEDVAAVPGRLTVINGSVAAYAYPEWAASVNTAKVLMLMNSIDPELRAVMEIKYMPKLIDALKEKGYELYEITDSKEGSWTAIMAKWESTMKAGIAEKPHKYPIFYTAGGFAREGAVVVSGPDAVTVANKVIELANII